MSNLTFIVICTLIGTNITFVLYPQLWWVGGVILFISSIIGCIFGEYAERWVKGVFK